MEDGKGFLNVTNDLTGTAIYLPPSKGTVNLKATINGVSRPIQVIAVAASGDALVEEYFEKVKITNFPSHTNGGTVEVKDIKEEPGFSNGDMFWLPDGIKKLFKYRGAANGYTGKWNGFRVVAENGGDDDSTIVTNGELDVSDAFQSVTIQNLQPNVVAEIKSNNEPCLLMAMLTTGTSRFSTCPPGSTSGVSW